MSSRVRFPRVGESGRVTEVTVAAIGSKSALVCGAGGFIGSHLVRRLKREGFWVRGVDLKYPEFSETEADDFVIGDLRSQQLCSAVVDRKFDEVYQLAADMGGAGYIFTGEHDADVMHNSATINLNIVDRLPQAQQPQHFLLVFGLHLPGLQSGRPQQPARAPRTVPIRRRPTANTVGRSSSASDSTSPSRATTACGPAWPGITTSSGPEGTWQGGKEKAPAAICRKIATAKSGDAIQIWGDGEQTRSFLYVDQCLERDHAPPPLLCATNP